MACNISGVILAGGAGKRFWGRNKSNIPIAGETIMKRMICVIENIFDEIIIVTNTPEEFIEFNRFKIIRDQFIETGPLGGIHAAIETSSKEAIFVFAGDMPFISGEVIINQINYFNTGNYDAIVPQINSLIEPLHSIYNNSVRESLKIFLEGKDNFPVRDFLDKLNVNYMQMEDTKKTRLTFTNINTPDDLLLIENQKDFCE